MGDGITKGRDACIGRDGCPVCVSCESSWVKSRERWDVQVGTGSGRESGAVLRLRRVREKRVGGPEVEPVGAGAVRKRPPVGAGGQEP